MKQEFDFYIDERVMIWNRLKFSVEAETLEEAKDMAIFMVTKDREDIEFYDSEILHDTLTEMEVGDNDGNSTLELYCEKDTDLIYENSDAEKVEWLGNRFFNSGYNIKNLLEDIFTSDWFYAEKNIGTKIKSPIELLAGIRRFLPMQMNNDQAQLLFQRTLGQVLFYPPNVAGWPGGKNWIDSSTLMLRLRIPQILTANEVLNIRPKDDDDVMMGQMMEAKMKKIYQENEVLIKGDYTLIDEKS